MNKIHKSTHLSETKAINYFRINNVNMFIFIFILSISFFNTQSYSQIDCYTPPTGVVCDEDWTPVTVNRVFSLVSGCYITVTYSYRECRDYTCSPAKKIIQFNLGGIDIPDDCEGLMAQLFPGYPNNWGGIMNQANWNDMIDKIFFTLGQEYILSHNYQIPQCQGEPPTCGDAPTGCGNSVEIYYTQPFCRAYCIQKSQVLPAGYRNISIFEINCDSESSQACCEHRKYFCYCGGVLKVTNINTYTQGSCNVQLEPNTVCPLIEGYERFFIGCSENCSE